MRYAEWPFVRVVFRLSVGKLMEMNCVITSLLVSGNYVEVDARCLMIKYHKVIKGLFTGSTGLMCYDTE